MKRLSREKLSSKGIIGWVVLVSVMLLVAPPSIQAQEPSWPKSVSILSKGAGGYSYPIAVAMGRVIEKNLGISAVAEPVAGSVAQLELLRAKKAELSLSVTNVEMWNAYHQKEYWAGKPIEIRMIMTEVPLWLAFIVRADSKIYSIKDLADKVAWDRLIGSTSMALWADGLYEIYGIKGKVRSIKFSQMGEIVNALKEKRADAIHWPISEGTAGIAELATTIGVRFLPIETKEAKELQGRYPYFSPTVMPANTYKGQDKDVPLVVMTQGVATIADQPDSFVYAVTKALMEHHGEWAGAHVYGRYYSIKTYFDDPIIPYHAGCIKYYREKGVWGREQDEIQKRLLSEMGKEK